MKCYLDADISQRVAAIVRRLDPSIDITSALELRHQAVSDRDELRHAILEGRCIITRNYKDFDDLTTECLETGRAHTGVLLVPSSLPNDNFSGIAKAIVAFAQDYPDATPPNFVGYPRRTD
ncbi:MAG: DUF5615 family PIN-like protein [Dehalococcoidia bacterium]